MSISGSMRRRDFVRAATGGAALMTGARLLPSAWAAGKAGGGSRPNVLVIMSDEHNASVAGCYNNPLARTPSLDALAAGGVTFESCYTNSPLCVPSRLSFTAGKYASRVGAWNNSCWLPSDDYPSIARAMTSAGYESLICGKMHYDATRRYGFRLIENIGNNSFKTGRGGRRDPDDLAPKKLSARFNEFYTGTDSSVLSHDRKVTEGVTKFLSERKKADKPFFLIAGFIAPHFPLIVADQYYQNFRGKVPMPQIPPGHLDALALNYKHLRVGFQMTDVPADIVRKGRELYYGLTEWFDKQVGMVLASLKKSGLADDTVVIYTTDHGENMGEHGLWWKNCMYEHAARVPLIVHWPQRWKGGQRRAGACSLVDVVKTLAEIGGAAAPEDWNGDSLCSWLDDPKAAWKDRAVSEYYAHNICSGYAMLRTGRHKLVYHTQPDEQHGVERELYDLSADPGEFTNLAARPEHKDLVEKLESQLFKELGEHPQDAEARCRADYAKGYGRGKGGGSEEGDGEGDAGGGKKGKGNKAGKGGKAL